MKPSDKVAYTEEIDLWFNGTRFSLKQGGEIRIEGVSVNTPIVHPSGVVIRKSGGSYVVSLNLILVLGSESDII